MIPAIVEQDQLVGANSLSQVTANLALVLGPILGTAIYFSIGPSWSLALDAISFLAVVGAIVIADLPDNPAAKVGTVTDPVVDLRKGSRICGAPDPFVTPPSQSA